MPYGKDGTYYSDYFEMKRADEAWLQRDKQNKLLKEQNKMKEKENELLQKQNELLKQQEEHQRLQNEEQQRHNKEMEKQEQVYDQNKNEMSDISNNNHTENSELKIQQFNMNQENISQYIDRGMMYLENEEYEKANNFFDMVLDINSHNAEAHLGKFLAEQNASCLNKLQDCVIFDLENSKNFMRALKYAEGKNRDILQKFFNNNKLKIEKAENEEKANIQKLKDVCKKLEENYKNTQKENSEIAQKLFYEIQEKIQKNNTYKKELEKQIIELGEKLKSLGFFKAKAKEKIKNEIENSKTQIIKMQKENNKLKEKYKIEMKKLYEQEENIIKELKGNANDPFIGEQITILLNNLGIANENEGVDDTETELTNAINEVIKSGIASPTELESKLNIGYAKAGRLIDEMEEMGIISEYQSNQPRKILLSKEKWLEIKEAKEYGRFYDFIKKL